MFNPNLILRNMLANSAVQGVVLVIARILLAYIFIVAGWGKITGYEQTAGYMASMGVSASLLPLVILLEFAGGLAFLVGFQTRGLAILFAVFSVVSAFLFHGSAEDANNFMKNLAMAGGFLAFLVYGAGSLSIDALLEKNK